MPRRFEYEKDNIFGTDFWEGRDDDTELKDITFIFM